jgi:hypothetical protein
MMSFTTVQKPYIYYHQWVVSQRGLTALIIGYFDQKGVPIFYIQYCVV